MKKHRCCTDAASAGNMSLSGEAGRNEMVLMAILSLKPLLTATCTATGVTILGRTKSTVCPVDPYLVQALGNISATASYHSSLTSTENHLIPKSHQGHRQLGTALFSAVNQSNASSTMTTTSYIFHKKDVSQNSVTSSSKGSLAVQKWENKYK